MIKRLLFLLFLFFSFNSFGETWYKSQIGTGLGNCGPASVAMAIEWSTGEKVSVEQIRKEIGYSSIDGATSFYILGQTLKQYKVDFIILSKITLNHFIDIVKSNVLIIVCLNTNIIDKARDNSKFGRIYDMKSNHYIIIKGIFDKYFKVEDPFNSPDRYYKISQVWEGMGGQNSEIIVVFKK